MGLFLENGSNNPIILRNNAANLFFAVPVTNKLKTGLDLYYKKTRCSLMSLMYLGMPSLYLLFYLPKKLRYNGGSFFVKRESILNGGLFLKNRVSVYLSIAVSIYLSAIG